MNSWVFGDKFKPRKNQTVALEWLANQPAKYLIVEAPVGMGKSALGLTFSKYIGRRTNKGDSYILTPQRILQKQYEDSFQNETQVALASLYGKNNYDCQSKGATCDIGSLVKPRCKRCPHTEAKKAAKLSPNSVMNYKLGLILFAFSDMFEKRKLIILDECHTLEQHLINFDAITAAEHRCKKFGLAWQVQKTFDDALEWFETPYLDKAKNYLIKLSDEIEPLLDKAGSDLNRREIQKLREYDKLQDYVDELEMFILQARKDPDIKSKWVLTHDKTMMEFKRLTGAFSFKRIIDPMADKILFMSSTVLNKEGFCRDLGIDPNDAAFLSLNSDFEAEKRPVFYTPQCKMNARWASDENIKGRRAMIRKLFEILEMHENDSGIIHTGNFAIAKWLVDELEGEIPQMIFHHNPESGDDRNAVINAFQAHPKPGLLISPSSTEGLDLKGDLSRFAIFAKIPFGFLGDQWIKRRMEMSSEWYSRRALIDVIQGGGRVVRGTDDWGNTYILDASWGYLFHRTAGMVPQWWKDAYREL